MSTRRGIVDTIEFRVSREIGGPMVRCRNYADRVLRVLAVLLVLALAGPLASTRAAEPEPGTGEAARHAVAVVIGNRGYRPEIPAVPYAGNDARAAAVFLREVLGYRRSNIIEMHDASQAEMIAMFGNAADHRGKLWSWIKPGRSDIFVFYSGHGVPGLRDRRGYLLPVDADPDTPELNGYPVDQLTANLAKLDARSVVVLLDACFTGDSAGGRLIDDASPVYVRTQPPVVQDQILLITAAQNDQLASWDHEARLGLFTRHVLTALGGAADSAPDGDRNGQITLSEVKAYLDETLTYAARRKFRRVQRADTSGPSHAVLVSAVPAVSWVPPSGPPDGGTPVAAAARGSGSAATAMPSSVSSVRGRFQPPGKDPGAVEAFVDRHGAELRSAILAYDRAVGVVPDQARISDMAWLRIVRAGSDGFDLLVQFRQSGAALVSYATIRIGVTDRALQVLGVWR